MKKKDRKKIAAIRIKTDQTKMRYKLQLRFLPEHNTVF